jgi:hypothetical protein
MCIEEFDAPVTTNVLAFQGLSQGKSASVVALLIGLGYDVLLENYVPTSLCGVSLKGEENCQCSVLIYLLGVHIGIGISSNSLFLRSRSSWVRHLYNRAYIVPPLLK